MSSGNIGWMGLVVLTAASVQAAQLKPRIMVLTDISPVHVEPEDVQSMIRLLVYANMLEIEGLVATTGWSSSGGTADWTRLIHQVIDAYEKGLPNLRRLSGQEGHLPDELRQQIRCFTYCPTG